MAEFEEGLFEYLDNHAGLSREVDSRIYPLVLPQRATLPAVTYQRISTPRLHEFEASVLPHPRFQFDCWAEDFERAKAVAQQVRAALDVYYGPMGDWTVQASIVEDERDIFEPTAEIWHSMLEAIIWYEE